ncbi:MAG: PD-(D/E)XK nuclease family protein [Candidatus Niyogibacteria bacterium]|nr:PD-(D/E)XK nuclease family protein [Candidatus Niyogibacteria bacterium]
MAKAKESIRVSPSNLNLFRECPRCFWLQMNENIHRPSGIFPSLPGGMDGVIKIYFDEWRKRGELPPEIREVVKGALFSDAETMKKWRNWRTGLRYEDAEVGGVLSGALDDCVVDGGRYMPLDYKTRGYPPKEGGESFYQGQLDAYTLLLEANGYPTAELAYLVYYFPRAVRENGVVEFEVEPKRVKTNTKNAKRELRDAIMCLRGPIPARHSKCDYCSWGESHGTPESE